MAEDDLYRDVNPSDITDAIGRIPLDSIDRSTVVPGIENIEVTPDIDLSDDEGRLIIDEPPSDGCENTEIVGDAHGNGEEVVEKVIEPNQRDQEVRVKQEKLVRVQSLTRDVFEGDSITIVDSESDENDNVKDVSQENWHSPKL